jgi:hypothetical protein
MCDTTGLPTTARGATVRVPAFPPSTLVLAGATGAAIATVVVLTSCAGMITAARPTGSEFTITRCGTAVTAPTTVWLA